MPRATLALLILAAVASPAVPATGALLLPVALPGGGDLAILHPFDPRSPALAAERGPLPPQGLWAGTLAGSGSAVRFVTMGESGLALVEGSDGLAWFVVEGGALVPFTGEIPAVTNDVELEIPHDAAVLDPPSRAYDGTLQIALVGDDTFRHQWGSNADEEQLAILSLVDAIFRANLGVPIEIVSQEFWTTPEPLSGRILCDGSGQDLLEQARAHYEATDPTHLSDRESLLVFTSKPAAPHPSGSGTLIGCAYIEGLANPYAYAAVRIAGTLATTPLDGMTNVLLTAHELGHNFAGHHFRAMPTPGGGLDRTRCSGSTIMYPFLCQNAPAFSHMPELPSTARELFPQGLVEERGNRDPMIEYALSRI